MATTKEIEVSQQIAEISRIARASVHNEELLKDVNRGIALYKDNLITKEELVEICDNVMEQTKYEIKIKQLKVETDYYEEVFNRAYSTTEYIPIVESNSISTEEPGDDILECYNYDNSEIIYMPDEVAEEITPNIIIYLDEIEVKQDVILYDTPKVESDIIIYDIVDNKIIQEEINEEIKETTYIYNASLMDNIYTYKYDQINLDSFGSIDTDNLTVEIINADNGLR